MSRLYLSNPCAFLLPIAHGNAGAVGARLSLRPLFERGTTNCKTQAKLCRENENACLSTVIASDLSAEALAKAEAKQSSFAATGKLDCFVAVAPRNDDAVSVLLTITAT